MRAIDFRPIDCEYIITKQLKFDFFPKQYNLKVHYKHLVAGRAFDIYVIAYHILQEWSYLQNISTHKHESTSLYTILRG